jgi:hypothetical protein
VPDMIERATALLRIVRRFEHNQQGPDSLKHHANVFVEDLQNFLRSADAGLSADGKHKHVAALDFVTIQQQHNRDRSHQDKVLH